MNLFWEIVKLLVVLGIVLMAIVYVIKFGLVRIQPEFYQQKGALKIVERLPLSAKSGLFLVRVGERNYLLGVSAENINLLAEINSEEIPPAPLPKNPPDFKNFLEKHLKETGDTDSFKNKLRFIIREKLNGGRSGDKDEQE